MSDNTATPMFTPPANDPWKGFRGVTAGTLILEAIVVGLTFPIVAKLGGGVTLWSGLYLGLLIVLIIAAAGKQGEPWAMKFDFLLQALVIVGGVIHWSIAVVGVVFLCVWVYIAIIQRDVRRRIARGQLPGQEPL